MPILLVGFFLLQHFDQRRVAVLWLVGFSFFYYAWWNPVYLLLLGGSIGANFIIGKALARQPAKSVLTVGILLNLGLLCYFKYANFFVDQWNVVARSEVALAPIVLPLAISFFTFQQIAFLVDAYKGYAKEYRFLDYCLFVSFFPQLIAGPIVHHKEMMPQFRESLRFSSLNLSVGLSYFAIGLFKKVVLADSLARYATPVFTAALRGRDPSLFEAWGGVLAYTGQIYFDFSGYSAMAIGLGWMLGIKLPVNFNSPYKAGNIIEFWRRWHITLSVFLRDYLYIPLGGNRKGPGRRMSNVMITMLLGGLWHGAGWTFVVWGGLHGLYLMINHGWRSIRPHKKQHSAERALYHFVTFMAVVIAWVFFRATSFESAWRILLGMFGQNGISVSDSLKEVWPWLAEWGIRFKDTGSFDSDGLKWVIPTMLIFFLFPNPQELFQREGRMAKGMLAARLPKWKPNWGWAFIMAVLFTLSLLRLREVSEFLYYNF